MRLFRDDGRWLVWSGRWGYAVGHRRLALCLYSVLMVELHRLRLHVKHRVASR